MDNAPKISKPPIGLKPRWLHDSSRASEILDAIERYTDANMSIPKAWIAELKDLFEAYFGKGGTI